MKGIFKRKMKKRKHKATEQDITRICPVCKGATVTDEQRIYCERCKGKGVV